LLIGGICIGGLDEAVIEYAVLVEAVIAAERERERQ